MGKLINTIAYAGMIAAALVIVAFQLYTRFTNVDMTETRLIIHYWREYLALLIALFSFLFIYRVTDG
jgi:hypothetical protein